MPRPRGPRSNPTNHATISRGSAPACEGFSYDYWFGAEETQTKEERQIAKKICNSLCPIKDWCRNEADILEANLPFVDWWGVWGGEDKFDRRTRRERNFSL